MTRLHWLTAAVVAALATSLSAGRQPGAQAEESDLRGVVRSPAGAEAGVWVIAETDELDTRFRKIVVTGDDGRFLVPDLPAASYRVWVRGYGLVDSAPVTARPGQTLTLEVTPGRHTTGGGRGLSGQLLVLAARAAARLRVPGHRAGRATASRAGFGPRPPGSTSPSRAASSVIRWATDSLST